MKNINKIVRQKTLSKETREWIKQIKKILKSIWFDLQLNIDYIRTKQMDLNNLWDRESMRNIILKNFVEKYGDD